ncbi:hypothetical protein QYM36_019055 [Artemia franciscana]|uniref:Uncharacterized protein n=1 Tax=Artemia franciscana TaxID=6661 RepID=A0AA88HBH0_ARTSF|nr:hypothetical protein QYM36_019055 [Artemia franciscana]
MYLSNLPRLPDNEHTVARPDKDPIKAVTDKDVAEPNRTRTRRIQRKEAESTNEPSVVPPAIDMVEDDVPVFDGKGTEAVEAVSLKSTRKRNMQKSNAATEGATHAVPTRTRTRKIQKKNVDESKDNTSKAEGMKWEEGQPISGTIEEEAKTRQTRTRQKKQELFTFEALDVVLLSPIIYRGLIHQILDVKDPHDGFILNPNGAILFPVKTQRESTLCALKEANCSSTFDFFSIAFLLEIKSKVEEQCATYKAQLDSACSQIQELENQVKGVEKLKLEVNELKLEKAEHANSISTLNKNLDDLLYFSSLHEHHKRAPNSIEGEDGDWGVIKESSSEKDVLLKETDQLGLKLQELETARNTDHVKEELMEKLEESQKELEEANAKVVNLTAQVNSLEDFLKKNEKRVEFATLSEYKAVKHCLGAIGQCSSKVHDPQVMPVRRRIKFVIIIITDQ